LAEVWSIHAGRDRERKAQRLKSRFQKISRRYERSIKLRYYSRQAKGTALVALLSFALTCLVLGLSPWTPGMTIKHVAAFPHCTFARAVGLAPAYRGNPGYWSRQDEDGNGRSCS